MEGSIPIAAARKTVAEDVAMDSFMAAVNAQRTDRERVSDVVRGVGAVKCFCLDFDKAYDSSKPTGSEKDEGRLFQGGRSPSQTIHRKSEVQTAILKVNVKGFLCFRLHVEVIQRPQRYSPIVFKTFTITNTL